MTVIELTTQEIRTKHIHKRVRDIIMRIDNSYEVDEVLRMFQQRPRHVIAGRQEPFTVTKSIITVFLEELEKEQIIRKDDKGKYFTIKK